MPNKIKSMHLKHRLIQRLNNEKVELSYTLLAEYLLNHYDDLEDLNIEKICDDNYISISTLRRFCQSLGYDNFTDLKESQQDDYNDRRVLNINLEENINTLFQKYNYKNADIDDFIAYMKNYEHVFALFPSNLYSVTFNFQQQLLTLV